VSKNFLAEEMSKEIDVKKYQTYDFIALFIETVVENLRLGKKVVISGFGTFVVKERRAKKVINPVSKTPMVIAPRKTVKFIPSRILTKHVAADG
jgi:DNA-binding protein HU-beta